MRRAVGAERLVGWLSGWWTGGGSVDKFIDYLLHLGSEQYTRQIRLRAQSLDTERKIGEHGHSYYTPYVNIRIGKSMHEPLQRARV